MPSSVFLVLLVLAVGAFIFILIYFHQMLISKSLLKNPSQEVIASRNFVATEIGVSVAEKEAIDRWIEKNNLNPYGDPKGTGYIGGTPLYNEETGETTDRYVYLVHKFPKKPWYSETN